MKPISKCLAAGSLAAIALFGYKERFDIRSFFNAPAKNQQVATNEKRDVFSQSAEQLQQSAPLIISTAAINVKHGQVAPLINKPQHIAKQAGGIPGESGNTVDFLSHAEVLSYKQAAFKKNIDISKLTPEMSAENISTHLKIIAPSDDSAVLDDRVSAVKMPESIALENNQPVKQESSNIQQEKIEREPAIAMPQKLAGTAYEGGVIAVSAKTPTLSNTIITKSEIKSEKDGQNAENNMAAFASLRQADHGADTYSYTALYEGTEQLKEYAVSSGSNTDYAIIVNLGIKSGKKRFFVIDFSTNTIVKSGIVAEGSGDVYSMYEKRYSNEIGSMASSLGIYKIGKRTKSNVNYSYRLYGMQESNSNAFTRSMLLQASEDIPYNEVNVPLFKTDGSLSLSARLLKEISPMLDASVKPVLLWVYDPSAENQPLYSAIQKAP